MVLSAVEPVDGGQHVLQQDGRRDEALAGRPQDGPTMVCRVGLGAAARTPKASRRAARAGLATFAALADELGQGGIYAEQEQRRRGATGARTSPHERDAVRRVVETSDLGVYRCRAYLKPSERERYLENCDFMCPNIYIAIAIHTSMRYRTVPYVTYPIPYTYLLPSLNLTLGAGSDFVYHPITSQK